LLETKEILGFETHLRWDHFTRGILYPSDFITAADESGIPLEMANQMLRDACSQVAAWNNTGIIPGFGFHLPW